MGKRCQECRYDNELDAETCSLCSAILPVRPVADMVEEPRQIGKGSSGRARHTRVSDDRVHYLVPYNGEPIELKVGVRFVLGRHRKASMQLQGEEISKQHAEVIWTTDDPPVPKIRDIDSRNGTFLNERKVVGDLGDELRSGDVIRLASSFTCYYSHSTAHELDKWVDEELRIDDTRPLHLPEGMGGGGGGGASGQALEGYLDVLPGRELFLMSEYLKLSGRLYLNDETGRGEGWVDVDEGQPLAAEYQGRHGVAAIRAMSELESGRFEFEAGE